MDLYVFIHLIVHLDYMYENVTGVCSCCNGIALHVRINLVSFQSSDGSTAMHLAASVGTLSLIELLLLNGANPDVRDFEGRLPLHWATIQSSSKTITLLLQVL